MISVQETLQFVLQAELVRLVFLLHSLNALQELHFVTLILVPVSNVYLKQIVLKTPNIVILTQENVSNAWLMTNAQARPQFVHNPLSLVRDAPKIQNALHQLHTVMLKLVSVSDV